MVKLYESVNEIAMAEGYTLLPKQVSDLFQIETSYLRQNSAIVIILHVSCINVQELVTILKHLYFLYLFLKPQATTIKPFSS
jgi:hypothetical protein